MPCPPPDGRRMRRTAGADGRGNLNRQIAAVARHRGDVGVGERRGGDPSEVQGEWKLAGLWEGYIYRVI